MKINNFYKLILYFSSNDRDTVIHEIAEFIDSQDDIEEVKLETIEQFIASRQRGTKCDNK